MVRVLVYVQRRRQACTTQTYCHIQTVKPCSKPATERGSPPIPLNSHPPIDAPTPFSHWANKTEEMTQGKDFIFFPRLALVPSVPYLVHHAASNLCRENQGRNEPPGRNAHLWQDQFKLLAEIQ